MPANKRRQRHSNGNTSTTPTINLKSSTNSITNYSNNLNGFVVNGNNHNGYHHLTNNSDHHQIKSQGYSSGATILNGGINITPKQQQQLDRNAFLLTLTKDQLKLECRKRGQKTTGTKTELVRIHIFIH